MVVCRLGLIAKRACSGTQLNCNSSVYDWAHLPGCPSSGQKDCSCRARCSKGHQSSARAHHFARLLSILSNLCAKQHSPLPRFVRCPPQHQHLPRMGCCCCLPRGVQCCCCNNTGVLRVAWHLCSIIASCHCAGHAEWAACMCCTTCRLQVMRTGKQAQRRAARYCYQRYHELPDPDDWVGWLCTSVANVRCSYLLQQQLWDTQQGQQSLGYLPPASPLC